jgi:PAS domain S-box-containing protein
MDRGSAMTSLSTDYYMKKAVEALCPSLRVITPDYRIHLLMPTVMPGSDRNLTGEFCYAAFFDRHEPCPDCAMEEVLRQGRTVVRDITLTSREQTRHLIRYVTPIWEDGAVTAVAVLDLDPAQTGHLETDLSNANAFLKNLINSSVDGVIASDMSGRILIFNDAASQITGHSRSDALAGLNIRQIYPGDGAREIMQRMRSEDHGGLGKLKSLRVDLLHRDGFTVPVNLSASVVYECDHEVATVGFFYDLREKRRLEEELQQAHVQLVQAEKMSSVGKLAAGVAHQINNPLAGILLYSQLLMEDYDLPPRARQDLQRIVDDAERCQEIVRELLDFSRQSAGETRPVDLNRALARTIFLLENQPLFKEIEITNEFDPDLPLVPSDLQQLGHVFMNIILNAAEAMEGRGRLRLKTGPATAPGRVRVEISDTGPGIPDEVLPHVFEPFFTTKEEGRGTGLGLSVAYGVVQNHGGRITVCSNPGAGTTFVIELLTEEGAVGWNE